MIAVFLVLILSASAFALFSRDLLYGAISLSAVSAIAALLFYLLHAPDLAITEAAVGSGVSTVIFIWAIRETSRRDES